MLSLWGSGHDWQTHDLVVGYVHSGSDNDWRDDGIHAVSTTKTKGPFLEEYLY
jgi:hypothetical protein